LEHFFPSWDKLPSSLPAVATIAKTFEMMRNISWFSFPAFGHMGIICLIFSDLKKSKQVWHF